MKNILKYKDYEGSIEIDAESKCLYGKILFIDDVITYEGNTFAELENCFHESVDDYIETCKAIGKAPQKSYSGTFNVRIGSKTHHILVREAQLKNITLNSFVKEILDQYTKKSAAKDRLHQRH